jgi:arylsulfatase A
MKLKLLMGLLALSSLSLSTQAAKQPNLVVILADDAGFEEFGIYKVKKGIASNTPNIDRLGENGVTFAHCWAQAICGPSRSMILTGNYAVNNGAYDNKLKYLPGPKLTSDERSAKLPYFTKILKDVGYQVAVAGKWHNPAGYMMLDNPKELGVDEYCMWDADPKAFEERLGYKLIPDETWEIAAISGEPKISRYWKPGVIQNDKVMPTTMKDYGPNVFSDFICDFINKQAQSDKPFLAYYTSVLPHGAHTPTPDDVAKGAIASNANVKKGTPQGMKNFLSQVNYLDKLVGKIVKTIEDAGIADNTIILFASDNGTTSSAKGKGVEYGVHVPFVAYGPGIKKRGMTRELMDFTDVLPTLVDFAGATLPSDKNIDGISLKAFLTGNSETTKDVIYSFPGVARLVRTKDYMIEAVSPLYDRPEGRFYKTNASWDGRGYENISHHPEYAPMRKNFEQHMSALPSKLPTSFDDEAWKHPQMQKGYKFYTNPKVKSRNLRLPLAYQFYDDSFEPNSKKN